MRGTVLPSSADQPGDASAGGDALGGVVAGACAAGVSAPADTDVTGGGVVCSARGGKSPPSTGFATCTGTNVSGVLAVVTRRFVALVFDLVAPPR